MIRQVDTFQQEFCMLKTAIQCLIVLLATVSLSSAASPPGGRAVETVRISAEQAYEGEQSDVLHFSGNFNMQSDEWQLESSKAIVYGRPDRPERVYLQGMPARFLIRRGQQHGQDTVEATAQVVEYWRSTGMLKLSGGATLKLDGEVITSSEIEYDTGTERYRASGMGGVAIKVPPTD